MSDRERIERGRALDRVYLLEKEYVAIHNEEELLDYLAFNGVSREPHGYPCLAECFHVDGDFWSAGYDDVNFYYEEDVLEAIWVLKELL